MKFARRLAAPAAFIAVVVLGFCAAPVQAQSPWAFKASSIVLDRGHPDGLLLMQDSANAARNLNAAALDLGWHHGWDIGGIRQGNAFDFEFEVMHVNDWDGGATAIAGPASLVQINNVIPTFVPGVTAVNASYESTVFSPEINLRRNYNEDITFLLGLRFMKLNEHFQALLVNAGPTVTYDTATSNNLFGGQIGVDTVLARRGPFTLEMVAKMGLYHNTAKQSTVLNAGAGVLRAGVIVNALNRDRGPAFLGELELASGFQLSDNVSFRAGYMLMWLESIALAPEQVVVTNFANGMGIDTAGGTFFHGALFQFIITR